MRAFAQEAFGEPGSIREVEVAEPQAGEVRVRVISASVNPVDWKTGLGYLKDWLEHKFPLVLGQDLSGIVDAVGPGVTDLKVGDEVFGGHGQPYMGRGTFAQYVIAATPALAMKPADFSHIEASSIRLAGVTALMSVDALGEIRGQRIVILGAAGGVGSAPCRSRTAAEPMSLVLPAPATTTTCEDSEPARSWTTRLETSDKRFSRPTRTA